MIFRRSLDFGVILTVLAGLTIADDILPSRQSLTVRRGQVVTFDMRDYVDLRRECDMRVVPTAGDYAGVVAPRRTSCSSPIFAYSHYGGPETNLTLRFYLLCSHGLFRTYVDLIVVPSSEIFPLLPPLIVPRPGGSAVLEHVPYSINGSLGDGESSNCVVTVAVLPRHGTINFKRTGAPDVPCHQLAGSISYRHFRGAHPTDRLTIKIHSASDFVRYVQIEVRVSGEGNRPPQIGHRLGLWGQRFTDDSTPVNQMTLRPMNFPVGTSLFSSFTGKRILTDAHFFQEELLTGGIALETSQDLNATIPFQIFDEDGAWITVNSSIAVTNYKAYNLLSRGARTGLLLREGASSPLRGYTIQNLGQQPMASDISITVVNGPVLGSLLVGGVQTSHFSLDDLIESRVVYRNTRPGYRDFIKFNVAGCGVLLYPIYVIQEDRRAPTLSRVKDLVVGTNGRVALSMLTVTDPDSHPDDITYQLNSATYGRVYLRKMGSSEENEVSSWTQKDVIEGRITYKLNNRPAGGGTETMLLTLADKAIPPNVSPQQQLQIRILRDSEPPKLVMSGALHAPPGTPILVDCLQATDVWSPNHLTYTPRPAGGGLFTTVDGSILHVFTQAMIDRNQVYFILPPGKTSGLFEVPFSVSDGDGNILHDQVMKVHPAKSSLYQSRPPDEVMGVLYVPEGGSVELSEDVLGIDDEDDDDDDDDDDFEMDFFVDEPPKLGRILVDDSPSTRFNSSSLFLGDVSYEHDGSETGRFKEFDRFTLRIDVVGNRRNTSRRIGVEVVVEPVDDSPPRVEIKRHLSVDEGSQTTIGKENVVVWDEDTDDKRVICDVVVPPTAGTVHPIPFTAFQLSSGSVVYSQTEHFKKEPMEDNFVVSCHDVNPLRKNSGRLTVAIHPLNDEEPILLVQNVTTNFAQLSKIVKPSDLDSSNDELTMSIVRPPRIGAIKTKLNDTSNFTVDALEDLYYEGAQQVDDFVVGISDGKFFSSQKIFVDGRLKFEPLQINRGLEVKAMKEVLLTKTDLYAKTDKGKIAYLLKNPPMFGLLLKRGKELGMGDSFTQDDVNDKYLIYKHTDRNSLMDVFVVDVTDGFRTAFNKNVFVTIRGDFSTFDVRSTILRIRPRSRTTLSDDVLTIVPSIKAGRGGLSTVDVGVVSAPSDEGHLERRDKTAPIRTFNYDQIQNDDVVYVDTSGRQRAEILQLEISDGKSTSFHSLTVVVGEKKTEPEGKLVVVKNEPVSKMKDRHPRLDRPAASILATELKTEFMGNESDVVVDDSGIFYAVVLPPKFGQIFNAEKNESVTSFTQEEVTRGSIAYLLTSDRNSAFGDSAIIDIKGGSSTLKGIQLSFEWSLVNFNSNLFVCDETDEELKLEFQRTGSLRETSTVELNLDGGNTTTFDDFVMEEKTVTFEPGQSQATLDIKIKNDRTYEQMETLLLRLTNAKGCLIGKPSAATVYIFDDEDEDILGTSSTTTQQLQLWSDSTPQKREDREDLRCSSNEVTSFKFTQSTYEVEEEDGIVNAEILRSGDLSGAVSLICFSETNSATAQDFKIRPKNASSEIIFGPGELRKNCSVQIKNDDIFEGNEEFTLFLKCVDGLTKLGTKSTAKVIVSDNEDGAGNRISEDEVNFENEHYFVKEPKNPGSKLILVVSIVREGNYSISARRVEVTSYDGTASNGTDYLAFPTELVFDKNVKTRNYEVEILSDSILEIREFFTLKLKIESDLQSKFRETVVHISDTLDIGGLMFPRPPQVISLKNFDQIDSFQKHPIQGYPLICLSVCDQLHRYQSKFNDWCASYNITTSYRWQIEDLSGDMKDIQDQLFFTKTTLKTLDSVYFRGGYRVRCGAIPAVEGTLGKISYSSPVTISRRQGLCPPPKDNMIGAEPFMSHLTYNDINGTRGLKISVTMAHHDGLFPALSTRKVSSYKEIMATYPMRALHHKCSNLVTTSERITRDGFIEETPSYYGKELFLEPYEISSDLRGNDTVRVYKYLDLKSCMWHFETVFTLGEALEVCGATVKAESEKDEASVLLELPLFVSYFTHSLLGWQRTDSSTNMRLKFTYKTSTISKGDIGAMIEEKVEGHLVATNMFIAANGSLVVYFTTKPKFAGFFLYEVSGQYLSKVVNLDKTEQTFSLVQLGNLTSEENSITQSWVFSSDFASVDYSGRYEIWLIPCVSQLAGVSCNPRPPIPHLLQIQFQQVVDPVLKKYSLDTEFKLKKRKRELFAGNGDEPNDVSVFEPGDYVEGIIEMVPPQDHLTLDIRRCYICAGRNGHVPKFDPLNKEFGCLMDSPELHFTMKLIDKDDGASVQKAFYNQFFNATFTQLGCPLQREPAKTKNCDAFIFDITPLFNQPLSKIWYVHCTYSISVNRGKRRRRALPEYAEETEVKTGTNIHQIVLRDLHNVYPASLLTQDTVKMVEMGAARWYLLCSIVVMGISLLISCCLIAFFLHLKRQINGKNSKYYYVSYNNCESTDTNH